nr:hypothetical protein [uncultured Mediterranean phage uvMED]
MAIEKNKKRYKSSVGNIGVATAGGQNYVGSALESLGSTVSQTAEQFIKLENAKVQREEKEIEDNLQLQYIDVQGLIKIGDIDGAGEIVQNMLQTDNNSISNWTSQSVQALGYGELAEAEAIINSKGSILTNNNIQTFMSLQTNEKYLALNPKDKLTQTNKLREDYKTKLADLYGIQITIDDQGNEIVSLKPGLNLTDVNAKARIENFEKNQSKFDTGLQAKTELNATENIANKNIAIGKTFIQEFQIGLMTDAEINGGIIDQGVQLDNYRNVVSVFSGQEPMNRNKITIAQMTDVRNSLLSARTNSIVEVFRDAPSSLKTEIYDWVFEGARENFPIKINGVETELIGYNAITKLHAGESELNNFTTDRNALETRLNDERTNNKFAITRETVKKIESAGGQLTDANINESDRNNINTMSDDTFAFISNLTLADLEIGNENYVATQRELEVSDKQIVSNLQWNALMESENSIYHKNYIGLTIDEKNKRNIISWINASPENLKVALPFITNLERKWEIGGPRIDTGSLLFDKMKDEWLPMVRRYKEITSNMTSTDLEVFNFVTNPQQPNFDESSFIKINKQDKKLNQINYLDILDIEDIDDFKLNESNKFFRNVTFETGNDDRLSSDPYSNLYQKVFTSEGKKTLPFYFGEKEVESAIKRFLLTDNGIKDFIEREFKTQILDGAKVEEAQTYVESELSRIFTVDPMSYGGVIPKNQSITFNGFNTSTHGKKIFDTFKENGIDTKDLEFGKDVRFGFISQADYQNDSGEIISGNAYYPLMQDKIGNWTYITKPNGEPLVIHYAPKLASLDFEERYKEVEKILDLQKIDQEGKAVARTILPVL